MVWPSVFNFLQAGVIVQAFTTIICIFLVYKCTKYLFGKATSEEPLKANTLRRRLGLQEDILDTCSVERGGSGNICLAVSLTSKQSLSQQHVRDALVLMAKRQPMLRAVISTFGDGYKYFEINEINEVINMLDIASSTVKASDWKDIWFEYTSKQLSNTNGLLWRVVILQEEFRPHTDQYANTLLFSFNHSCTDGVSCVKFCEQFLRKLNDISSGTIDVDQKISSLNLLPYFQDLVTRERTPYSILTLILTYCGLRPILRFLMHRMIFRQVQAARCNPYSAQFPPRLDVSSFVGTNGMETKVFTEKETKNILLACKVNNCTVTGALTAAAHLTFCELVEDGMKGSKDVNLKCSFSINSLRCCNLKPHKDYLGYFVYYCDELYLKYMNQLGIDFWKVAQETTKQIQDCVKKEEFVLSESIMNETIRAKELVDLLDRELLVRISCCNFISSFGSFNFAHDIDKQTYKLQDCFVNSLTHGFPHTFNHYNHTINGRMIWQIIYDASIVETHHAKEFANRCFSRFLEMASDQV
ncbi:uncharacterized protein LOC114530930 [Dendronephthya gigantea]|uniref:uncharacterized protein LOC114530930 n=1 Tax=Dendronephthya gigantea TaxID=151771 RepID=UPI00106913AC|nr:uncharacterized protein LOC114530930 [Dendronephthya gigantea]